ncbi:MAG: leucine-rich repeat protein, partial [Ruminococcus sp.]
NSIVYSAFFGCSNLTSMTISNNITIIKSSTFLNCSSLTSITIPDSVTSIGDFAFYKCSSLASITIPDSVTSIGDDAFSNCESLTAISLSCKSSLKKSDFGDQANLVSYASHTLKKIEAKAATCTENGNIEHWTCEHCGKYFLSDDSNPETAKAVELSEITIPTIKHSYDKNGFCKNDDTHYQPATYNEESEKYEISNAGQLYWFAEQVNSGNASLNAVLTTDIVVNETVLAADGSLGADPDTLRMWRSIGNDDAENIFKGTFDGQGHTISGLYFSNDSNESNVMCASLFGVSAGIIQNVGLEDSYLNHYNISAGICAINNGQIVNCYNAGTILGYGASGICAINSDNGSIENCYNTGVIRGFGLVAGICNMNTGSMKDCYNNNSDITVMTDSTIIDENDEKSYASGICNNNGSSGRIENCYHVGQVSGADVNNNICNLNAGQIENSYYDCNICDKDAITQNESSAVMKNVESKTTKQFASGEVTYLLNGDQSAPAFYQNLATEKYPVLNPQSKAVVRLELIQDESFGEAATTKTTYHNTGDTVALETSPDKAYMYQYFVNEKKISGKTYTIKNNTEMTMKKVPVDIELSEIDTIQLTCQKKMTLDLTEYLKNFVDLKPVQFQLATGSKLPDGLKLTEDGILSGTPKKAATVKTTIVLTAENDSTKEMNLVFIVNAPVTTTTTTITTTTTTKATTTTKPSKTTTTKVTTTTKPNKTTTTKATTTTTTTISSYGDVNLDGMVDILDAVFLNKYLATLIQFSDAQMANADCCQDGVLNDQDTTALMQFIILLIDDLPVQPTEK